MTGGVKMAASACPGRQNVIAGAESFAQSSFKIDVKWIDSLASLFGV